MEKSGAGAIGAGSGGGPPNCGFDGGADGGPAGAAATKGITAFWGGAVCGSEVTRASASASGLIRLGGSGAGCNVAVSVDGIAGTAGNGTDAIGGNGNGLESGM